MTLLSIYPYTPFRGSWLYTAMGSAPAGAQGVRDALDILLEKKRITQEEDLQVVVLTGDGSAGGIGFSATSGVMDRKLDFFYICYDNEAYGNTGGQFSEATPHGAKTTTSKGAGGYSGTKKDLFSIWVAHNPVYVATVVGAEPLDLAKKIEKAKELKGPKMIIGLSPCPTVWSYNPKDSVVIGKLAVKTGIWPLKEYVDGVVVHTKIPKNRLPVEEYLKTQGRFSHLFNEERERKKSMEIIQEIQTSIDEYWKGIE